MKAGFMELVDPEGFGATLASYSDSAAAFAGISVGDVIEVSGTPTYMAMHPALPRCELDIGPATRLAVRSPSAA